jgi:hypothetical protein
LKAGMHPAEPYREHFVHAGKGRRNVRKTKGSGANLRVQDSSARLLVETLAGGLRKHLVIDSEGHEISIHNIATVRLCWFRSSGAAFR